MRVVVVLVEKLGSIFRCLFARLFADSDHPRGPQISAVDGGHALERQQEKQPAWLTFVAISTRSSSRTVSRPEVNGRDVNGRSVEQRSAEGVLHSIDRFITCPPKSVPGGGDLLVTADSTTHDADLFHILPAERPRCKPAVLHETARHPLQAADCLSAQRDF
ncbi:hypothetical protein Y032_0115g519 [Ancylostoma ceylanicum]|uniref:Uncharacterized protein n=1 Tax=Ancylostoma ceylanicum TaxID=53326 RepID=A0A016TCY7_9BILA|nr:hypothetical protein Y032_0115g519 [Ancylostoma ceylanicum]